MSVPFKDRSKSAANLQRMSDISGATILLADFEHFFVYWVTRWFLKYIYL